MKKKIERINPLFDDVKPVKEQADYRSAALSMPHGGKNFEEVYVGVAGGKRFKAIADLKARVVLPFMNN